MTAAACIEFKFAWRLWTSPVVRFRRSPLIKSCIRRSPNARVPRSPLMPLRQAWGRIHQLWSRSPEETRYLATVAVVSCARCNGGKDGSPMWTKRVLRYLKGCYCCMQGKLRLGCWAGLRQGIMGPDGSPCSHFGSLIMLNCLSLSHAPINMLEFIKLKRTVDLMS